jgi:hypothetical protein
MMNFEITFPIILLVLSLAFCVFTWLKINKAISLMEITGRDRILLILSAIIWMVVFTLFSPKPSGLIFKIWPILSGIIFLFFQLYGIRHKKKPFWFEKNVQYEIVIFLILQTISLVVVLCLWFLLAIHPLSSQSQNALLGKYGMLYFR